MKIGKIIKEFVENKVPDRKDYKELLGMGYESMYKYFNDERKPGYEVLVRLVNLGFDITKIFPTSKEKTKNKAS